MVINVTKFRKNIYKLLDQVIETGIPIEIKRRGTIIKIIKTGERSKLNNLKKRNVMNCKPEEIVHLDWSNEWQNHI